MRLVLGGLGGIAGVRLIGMVELVVVKITWLGGGDWFEWCCKSMFIMLMFIYCWQMRSYIE